MRLYIKFLMILYFKTPPYFVYLLLWETVLWADKKDSDVKNNQNNQASRHGFIYKQVSWRIRLYPYLEQSLISGNKTLKKNRTSKAVHLRALIKKQHRNGYHTDQSTEYKFYCNISPIDLWIRRSLNRGSVIKFYSAARYRSSHVGHVISSNCLISRCTGS